MNTTLAERLEIILKHYKLTQKQFAESINYSPGNITDWIKGRYKPSSRALVNIQNTYKISQNWLINGTGNMFVAENSNKTSSLGSITEEEINIIKLYRKLSKENKIKIEGIMEMYTNNNSF